MHINRNWRLSRDVTFCASLYLAPDKKSIRSRVGDIHLIRVRAKISSVYEFSTANGGPDSLLWGVESFIIRFRIRFSIFENFRAVWYFINVGWPLKDCRVWKSHNFIFISDLFHYILLQVIEKILEIKMVKRSITESRRKYWQYFEFQ